MPGVAKEAKSIRKQAKKQLNKDYDHLKQDKLADQGKNLYAKGKTITGNERVTATLGGIGMMSFGLAARNYAGGGNPKVTAALAAVGGISSAVAIGKEVSDSYQNKRLRAYYAHTSNY